MLVGLVMVKAKVVSEENCKVLSAIVVKVANPALILSALLSSGKTIQGKSLLFTVILAGGLYAGLILLAQIIPKILKSSKEDTGAYKMMTIFSNIGFMGFPLVSAIYGDEALLYAAIFQIPYNLLIYTYGIETMRSTQQKKEENKLMKIWNIGVVTCLLTIILYVFGVKIPSLIGEAIQYLGGLTAPLSMLVIGASFASIDFKSILGDRRLVVFTVLKLIVIPLIGCFLLQQIVADGVLRGVCMIMLATPVGSMTAMMAQQYEGNYELTTKGVALTTVLSVITIPLIFAFFH